MNVCACVFYIFSIIIHVKLSCFYFIVMRARPYTHVYTYTHARASTHTHICILIYIRKYVQTSVNIYA